jgi:hypothetical protein
METEQTGQSRQMRRSVAGKHEEMKNGQKLLKEYEHAEYRTFLIENQAVFSIDFVELTSL